MKKVLIIGGAGYIGGLVVDILSPNFEVTIYDNLTYEELYLKDCNFIYGDIKNTHELAKIANSHDYVIFMAALVGDAACNVDPLETEWVNYVAVRDFCHMLDSSVKLIFFSTCSVYGINNDLITENSPTNPISTYASTKLKAEEFVLRKNGIVFRLGTVFGLGDRYSRIRLDLVANVMTLHAFYNKKIVVIGGDQWRPLISVRDIAGFTEAAINNFTPGLYILSSENVTMKSLGETIGNYLKVPIEFKDISSQDMRNYRVDGSKAISTFHYTPTVTIEEEVKNIYDLLQERRIRNPYSSRYHNGDYLKQK